MIRATTDLAGYEKFRARYVEAVDKAVGAAAASMQGDIRKSFQITGPLPGVKKGTSGQNVPSEPGETPAVQFGWLRKNLVYTRAAKWVWRVLSASRYSAALEFGYAPNNLQERPFMRPAMNSKANQKRALNVFRRVLKRSLLGLAGGGK